MKVLNAVVLIFLILCLFGCRQEMRENISQSKKSKKFEIKTKYANLFSLEKIGESTLITVDDPWKSKEKSRYFLTKERGTTPENLPPNTVVVQVPVKNALILSTSHIGYLSLLGVKDKINGVPGKGIFDKELRDLIGLNKIPVVGFDHNLNIEKVIDLEPDLIITSGMEAVHENLQTVGKSGIKIAFDLDWMEDTPLGRAEWIKFFGAFFCLDQRADSVFNSIEKKYLKVSSLVGSIEKRPKIFAGKNLKGTWYMPGGQSYMAFLLKDAGADYFYKNDKNRGSIPMSFEEVLENQLNVKYWLNPWAENLSSLLKEDERYSNFLAFKNRNVFQFTKRKLDNGANDYWESGLVNPHLLLADLIKVFHPSVLPNHKLMYCEKLN